MANDPLISAFTKIKNKVDKVKQLDMVAITGQVISLPNAVVRYPEQHKKLSNYGNYYAEIDRAVWMLKLRVNTANEFWFPKNVLGQKLCAALGIQDHVLTSDIPISCHLDDKSREVLLSFFLVEKLKE